MNSEIDWEHAADSFERALGHPLNEQAMSSLEALVAESLRIGSNRTIDAVKRLLEPFADAVSKADLLEALEGLRLD